jgi:hypothetical protein
MLASSDGANRAEDSTGELLAGNQAGRHGAPEPGHEETGRRVGNRSVGTPRGASRAGRYLALFVVVRRQRVQTSAFTGTPFWLMMSGWRFGW